jgi:hypothetical protein
LIWLFDGFRWALRTLPLLFPLQTLQRLILLSAPPLLASECNVTDAVQLKRKVGAAQSKATKLVAIAVEKEPEAVQSRATLLRLDHLVPAVGAALLFASKREVTRE